MRFAVKHRFFPEEARLMRSNPRLGQNKAFAAMLGRTWIDLSLAAGRGIECSTEPNLEASSLEEASIMGSNASPRLDPSGSLARPGQRRTAVARGAVCPGRSP